MFRYLCMSVLLFFTITNGFGQLIVNDHGSVSIGELEPQNPIRLRITTTTRLGSMWHYGLASSFTDMPSSANYFGAAGNAYRSTGLQAGRSYGVMGTAGNYTNGWNYGVYGQILGSSNGAGIYGTQGGAMLINDKYAGFFNGNVNVTGVLSVNGVSVQTSDQRTKQNIKALSETNNSLNGLLGLTPVSYNLNTDFFQTLQGEQGDTLSANEMYIEPQLADRIQRGFIAQELQEIFPDLVFEDNDGVLAINYIGLIPVIVDAIKEMQTQIISQEERIGNLETDLYGVKDPVLMTKSEDEINKDQDKAELYQIHPSPFNQQITIRHKIPEQFGNATLHIYNMQGTEILNYSVINRGYTATNLGPSELKPGMYLYTLIADGREVDTKRMILTE